MSRWDETIDFAQRIHLAQSSEAISRELLALTSNYGLTSFVAESSIPAPGLSPAEQKNNILIGECNEAWMRRYFARSYAYVSPVLHQVATRRGTSFAWDEARAPPGP